MNLRWHQRQVGPRQGLKDVEELVGESEKSVAQYITSA